MHFSEIIKLQLKKKKTPYIALYFTAFLLRCVGFLLFLHKHKSPTGETFIFAYVISRKRRGNQRKKIQSNVS